MSHDTEFEKSNDVDEEVFAPAQPDSDAVTVEDFIAYLPDHSYIFVPTREPWTISGVDARLPPIQALTKTGRPKLKDGKPELIKASAWIDRNRAVEQLTWCPGMPIMIPDRLVAADGGWITRKGVTTFNFYRLPDVKLGDAKQATPWLDHVRKVFVEADAEHCIRWFAHRVQRPGEKLNHALVLGGVPGIGKDSMLAPVKYAVGPGNFHSILPTHLLEPYNDYAKSVVLRVSEAHDLGEISRYAFYERTKIYAAAPPDVLRINEKFLRQYYALNFVGLIITTNYKVGGLYLTPDDRRHYFAWSDRTEVDFGDKYWDTLWDWYDAGGCEHVAAYLATLDLSDFDPKAPPPKTAAFWETVGANQAPENSELADVIDALGNPDALTPKLLATKATGSIAEWLSERKSLRALPHRLERTSACGIPTPRIKIGGSTRRGSRSTPKKSCPPKPNSQPHVTSQKEK
jgi:hypothetical protein